MIKKLTLKHVCPSAKLHQQGMPDDFLASFGLKFLQHLHQLLIKSKHIIALGYFEQNKLCGILIATTNTGRLFVDIFTSGFFLLIPQVFATIFTKPRTIKYLFQTLLYVSYRPERISAEIIAFSVNTSNRRQGIGTKLLRQLKKVYTIKNLYAFKVSTRSVNKPANQLYKKMGGILIDSVKIYDRTWNVYKYLIKKST